MDTSPFQKLSAELRNKIWELAIPRSTERHPIIISADTQDSCKQPAITRTCKQIRQESLGMFYATNVFNIDLHLRRVPGKDVFRDATAEACKWLKYTSAEQHRNVLQLFIDITIEREYFPNAWWSKGYSLFHRLGDELKQLGYESPRRYVSVELRPSRDENVDKDVVKERFSRVGLEIGELEVREPYTC